MSVHRWEVLCGCGNRFLVVDRDACFPEPFSRCPDCSAVCLVRRTPDRAWVSPRMADLKKAAARFDETVKELLSWSTKEVEEHVAALKKEASGHV